VFRFLRNLDLAILVLALPLFLATGWPIEGWGAAAVIWVAWRAIGAALDERTRNAGADLQRAAVLQGASSIGRGWMLLLGVLAAGLLISRDVGLATALLLAVLFTVSISFRLALRPILDRADAHPTA
jgi:hypothetical protein